MATSGTYAFNPGGGDLALVALSLAQLRGPAIQQEHLFAAANESNLLQVEWSNKQPNLWKSELYTVALVEGTATYTLPARMISPMAVYVTTDTGDDTFDRILGPLSTFEYAAMPQKDTEAPPTTYWYNKQVAPQVTLWPVPDQSDTYTLKLQILSQIEDASLQGGVNVDLPYLWLDAWVKGLAARIAKHFPTLVIKARGPAALSEMDTEAAVAWKTAATQGIEEVPFFIQPGLSSYYSQR
jgi:hypothetical protein